MSTTNHHINNDLTPGITRVRNWIAPLKEHFEDERCILGHSSGYLTLVNGKQLNALADGSFGDGEPNFYVLTKQIYSPINQLLLHHFYNARKIAGRRLSRIPFEYNSDGIAHFITSTRDHSKLRVLGDRRSNLHLDW